MAPGGALLRNGKAARGGDRSAGTVALESDSLSSGEDCGNARFAEWTSCSNRAAPDAALSTED
jgi:hypothetical protein